MLQSDWNDNLWTQASIDDWQPDNDPDDLDIEAANALFDMITQGGNLTEERMRSTVVLIRESQV